MLKRVGTRIRYPIPMDLRHHQLSVFVFAGASQSNASENIGILAGLLTDEIRKDPIMHAISRLSQKSKRPTRSEPASEMLAVS